VGRKHVGGWLARNAPDPVSVILLGKLAVDLAARHLGLGADLLTHAVRDATTVAGIVGARALVTEAIDEAAIRLYLRNNLRQSAVRADLLYLPLN